MIHWFTKRGRRSALFLGVPMVFLAFALLNAADSIHSPEDSDGDSMNDAYELFYGLNSTNPADGLLDYDGDALTNLAESVKLTDPFCEDTDRDGFFDNMDEKISRAYIHWGDPQFTSGDQYEYAHPDWFLGAYKNGGEWFVDASTTQSYWYVSGYGSIGVSSLCVDLDRTILTNNLRYAVHYYGGSNSSLYVDLLDTNGAACHANGVVVAENLYGNLLTGSNTESTIVLNIPTAKYPDAAVIQLKACHSRDLPTPAVAGYAKAGSGNPVVSEAKHDDGIIIYEGLLYIDEDNDGLDADQERQIGTSDYCVDSNHNGTNDYDECFNSGSSTNRPDDGGGGDDGDDGEDDDHGGHKKNKIIYVDQAIGNDTFTGRAPAVSASKKGPKKTVRAGLSIAGTNDTIIIRSGNYNENLNIQGKDVKVFIEGKVRL